MVHRAKPVPKQHPRLQLPNPKQAQNRQQGPRKLLHRAHVQRKRFTQPDRRGIPMLQNRLHHDKRKTRPPSTSSIIIWLQGPKVSILRAHKPIHLLFKQRLLE